MEKPIGKLSPGDVIVIPFPFSDATKKKNRPALVIKKLDGDDLIACAITSKANKDKDGITIEKKDFKYGSLPIETCDIRPSILFTASQKIIDKKLGYLKPEKFEEVLLKIAEILGILEILKQKE